MESFFNFGALTPRELELLLELLVGPFESDEELSSELDPDFAAFFFFGFSTCCAMSLN